ncbi:MAG TPA: Clp1/GlmU family protein [Candidatus Brocadiia bacterium]|nr:Clp1/GlmU family protein [Candidatus Brocadiales bacterium]
MNNEIDVPAYWQGLAEKIYNDRGVVIVLGSSDTGKTTLINYLFKELNNRGCLTSIIDADIGQSFYGVPTTINLAKPSIRKSTEVIIEKSYFVGSTSPMGHLLQMVIGLRKLLDSSHGCDVTLIDTTGFVTGGAAWELKYQKIEAVSPKHIVSIQRSDEIENILRPQEIRELSSIHRFPVHDKVKLKSQDQRRAYRQIKYKMYFQNARQTVFSLKNVSIINPYTAYVENQPSVKGDFEGILIGLNNSENFLVCLGIIDEVNINRKEISCLTPLPQSPSLEGIGKGEGVKDVKTIRIGSVRLDSTYEDYHV